MAEMAWNEECWTTLKVGDWEDVLFIVVNVNIDTYIAPAVPTINSELFLVTGDPFQRNLLLFIKPLSHSVSTVKIAPCICVNSGAYLMLTWKKSILTFLLLRNRKQIWQKRKRAEAQGTAWKQERNPKEVYKEWKLKEKWEFFCVL